MLANGLNLNSSVAVASISPQWPHSGPLGLAPGLRRPEAGLQRPRGRAGPGSGLRPANQGSGGGGAGCGHSGEDISQRRSALRPTSRH